MNDLEAYSENQRTINYTFKFSENFEKTFTIRMNSKTLDILQNPKAAYPEWTKLDCQKCTNCPLDESQHQYCPIAVKIVDTIEFFSKPLDFEQVDLLVETPERTFRKAVELKSAAVSLIGIYMVTSGCPIMDKLRPMARHHLPFATTQETTYRSIANYLIAQYIAASKGKSPDLELKHLSKIYEEVNIVNQHFRKRLLEVSSESHALQAILTLDTFAYYINLSLSGETFYSLESLFNEAVQKKSISFESAPEEKSESSEILTYQYLFEFENGYTKEFLLNIDSKTSLLTNPAEKFSPSWTELTCSQCLNCPLDETHHQYCPAAARISDTIEFFRETISAENVRVSVKTTEREFHQYTTPASGFSSMIGLLMMASGCPVLRRLKPLIRNHLPFETQDERAYRSLGMYLLHQKLLSKKGETPDWELNNFSEFYQALDIVNESFCGRLKEIAIEEDALKALLELDCFKKYTGFKISGEQIKDLQKLFERAI